MTTKPSKPKYAVLVPKSSGIAHTSGVGQIKLSIVEILDGGSLRNPGSDHGFTDLIFSAQWDDAGKFPTDQVYAFTLAYRDVYHVELRDAQRMAKVLALAEKKRSKWTVNPRTFGQWLALTAADLGLVGVRESRHSRGLSSYSENEYFEVSLRELQVAVDDAIATARNLGAPQENFTL